VALLLLGAGPAAQTPFELALARIDHALQTNPSGVSNQALTACKGMRDMAVKLYRAGYPDRAERRLKMCEKLLQLRN
jgi:hypothetical protein